MLVLNAIKKFSDVVERIQIIIGTVMFSTFLVAVVCQVASRFFKIPMVWTEDLANYSFIWSVFMGASVILYRKQHFKFTFIEMKLSAKWREVHGIITYGVILVFCLLVMFYGTKLVSNFWNYKWNSLPSLRMGYHWLCVPIMGFCMSTYSLGHIATAIDNIKQKRFTEYDLLKDIEETEHIEIEKHAEGEK